MGRNLSDRSLSPVGARGSPSPPRRENRTSLKDDYLKREKHSGRAKSPRRKMSLSPSPPSARYRSSRRDGSPMAGEKSFSQAKSPKREQSRSPSPRTKRLRRVQAERETEEDNKGRHRERETGKVRERERERSDGRGEGKGTRRERESDREYERDNGRASSKNINRGRDADGETRDERKERRSVRDENDGKPSKTKHEQSSSPSDRHHRSKHRSRSPQPAANFKERNEGTNSRDAERRDGGDDSLSKMVAAEKALEENQKQKPSYELSGKLAAETNRFRGITLLFNEPPDARKPEVRWRLYVFKGGDVLNEPLYIHRQSCYLFGRERRVADVPTDHPSCSKQHAVIQFRQVEKELSNGTLVKQTSPYLMDLGSTNKTFINDDPIEPQRYYELFERDTIKFGNSSHVPSTKGLVQNFVWFVISREYVLLHENSSQ